MKKYKLLLSVGIVLVAAGMSAALYPHVSNSLYQKKNQDTIEDFDEGISKMYEDTDTSELSELIKEKGPDYTVSDYVKDNNITPENTDKYDWALISLLREQMESYNAALIEEGQQQLADPFSYEQPSFLLSTYSIPDNVFGHISAPSINMDLPIYLGANQYNMNFGAVHLSYSSMPIGGESTNSVFAAHRGYIGKIFFDNIVFLNIGDDVYVTNPWGKRHYKVIETEVISPYDIDRCYIREGQDLITLLTCHPYGSSEYRYMVVCEFADEEPIKQ